MKKILIIGSGKSTPSLMKYLIENSKEHHWKIRIADLNPHIPQELVDSNIVEFISLDVYNTSQREEEIKNADLVISMLPAFLHNIVARDCVTFAKHMVTASYVSDEMRSLDLDAQKAGIIMLNEVGLDPGIDHMSAMKVIHELIDSGAEMTGFESFCGGLIAPEYESDNPWKYKFTWNPRNVVVAAQGPAAKFIQEGKYKYIPYHKIFRRTEFINIDGYGKFQAYANRDSLRYRDLYGLKDIKTFFRGTLRRIGFCRAWDMFVQLGMTDDSYIIEDSENMTHRDFINSFLAYDVSDSVELKVQHYLNIDQDSDLMEMLEWLDMFKNIKVGLKNATPAKILQHILERKWALDPDDKDMVVMWHKFDFIKDDKKQQIQSSMVVIGENQTYTAMAKTVGLPLGICVKLILTGVIRLTGVQLPLVKEIYDPVLAELEEFGITFKEKLIDLE